MNPGRGQTASIRHPFAALTAGFKPSTLMGLVPMAGGAYGNHWLRGHIAAIFPKTASGLASYGVGLVNAGAMLLIPRYGKQMFNGALLEEIVRAITEYFPQARAKLMGLLGTGEFFNTNDRIAGLQRPVGEYFTDTDQIEGMSGAGMNDYYTTVDGIGDFLDTNNVANQFNDQFEVGANPW